MNTHKKDTPEEQVPIVELEEFLEWTEEEEDEFLRILREQEKKGSE